MASVDLESGKEIQVLKEDSPEAVADKEIEAGHVFYSAAGSIKANDLAAILKCIEESWLHGDSASAAKLVWEARREYDAVESFLDPDRRPALAH